MLNKLFSLFTTLEIKNKLILFLILIILLLFSMYGCERNNNIDNKNLVLKQQQFNKVLGDSIKLLHNANGTITSQKTVLSANLDLLEQNNNLLSSNYKDLATRFKKDKNIISVLNLKLITLKDSIKNNKPIEITDTSITFKDSTNGLDYEITVLNVKPLKGAELDIKKIKVYNDIAVDYKFDKDGQILLDVTPKDTSTKVVTLDAIINDKITKEEVSPSFKDKLKKKLNNIFSPTKITSTLTKVGIGIVIGIAIVTLL
jgi:uncharacterized membrane-anchored protein